MRGSARMSLLICVFALATILAGCGSNDDEETIPRQDATELLNALDAMQTNVEDGDCDLARTHAVEVTNQVVALPSDVDEDLKAELAKAAENLETLAESDCTEQGTSGLGGAQPTPDETEPTSTETTPTTESSTTDTDTEPETETEPDEPTTTEEEPGGANQNPQPGESVPEGNGGGVTPPTGGVSGRGGGG